MSKVYGLKRATPRMKYQHMNMVLDFRANLADLKSNPPDRHVALDEIHKRLGGDFYPWFEQVYRFRRDNLDEEYEQAIFKKLASLIRKEKRQAKKNHETATADR